MMDMRVEKEWRGAERRRLQREAGSARQGGLFRQRWKVLAQFGGLLVSVGQRLERAGQIQAPSAERQASGRA